MKASKARWAAWSVSACASEGPESAAESLSCSASVATYVSANGAYGACVNLVARSASKDGLGFSFHLSQVFFAAASTANPSALARGPQARRPTRRMAELRAGFSFGGTLSAPARYGDR